MLFFIAFHTDVATDRAVRNAAISGPMRYVRIAAQIALIARQFAEMFALMPFHTGLMTEFHSHRKMGAKTLLMYHFIAVKYALIAVQATLMYTWIAIHTTFTTFWITTNATRSVPRRNPAMAWNTGLMKFHAAITT